MKRGMKYAVIRFVPDTTRGEAINLALIAGTDDRDWFDIAFTPSFSRVRALSGSAAEMYAKALVRDFDSSRHQVGNQVRLFKARGTPLEDLLFAPPDVKVDGVLQVGVPQPALTDNPEATFKRLFRQLIGGQRRPRRVAVAAPESRDALRRVFRSRALDTWGLPEANLVEGEVIGRVPHPVDFGLLNGQLRAVVHTVSFAAEAHSAVRQRAVLAEEAWDLTKSGASFTMLYAPAPESDGDARELQTASVDFMRGLGIRAVSSGEIDTIEPLVAEVVAGH